MHKQPIPETMLDAVRQFSDPQIAHDFFVQIRFPNGVACPRIGCGSARVAYLEKVRRWYCNECKRQFSAKVGTIFEDSPIGLDKWLPAIWLLAPNRNGISSYEIARGLKVTQKTAWFMLHRIRLAMQDGAFRMLTGTVEVDETYIGGKIRNKPRKVRKALRGDSTEDKTAVIGAVERGDVRAWSLPRGTKPTISGVLPKLRQIVHEDSTLHTDSAQLYKHINEYFLSHYAVNHSIEEYVRYVRGGEIVHTTTVECFWTVLKRTLGGTYVAPRPWHLDRYLDEQIFRFNERKNTDRRTLRRRSRMRTGAG